MTQPFENQTDELVHLTIGNDTIDTTPGHPFYVAQKGWYAAESLRAGDILVTVNGEYVILEQVQHEIFEQPVPVYNLEVLDYHTFFIGESTICTHNMCTNKGRSGKQQRLREMADDDKLPRYLRGEIKRDLTQIARGKRKTIRVPHGYNLAHKRGYSAKAGYSYAYSVLQPIVDHRRFHRVFRSRF
mgnify:CR=1 FL=1